MATGNSAVLMQSNDTGEGREEGEEGKGGVNSRLGDLVSIL